MKVVDGVLVVNSVEPWYRRERVGGKNCTVRIVDGDEWQAALTAMQGPDATGLVRVENAERPDTCFTRRMTWYGSVCPMLGKWLVIICWYP